MGHWGEHCSQVFQNAKREVNFLSNSYLVANNHDFGSGGENAWIEMNMTNSFANINVDLIIEMAMMMIIGGGDSYDANTEYRRKIDSNLWS